MLGGDARLPESGLSSAADQWLQEQVDHELSAGVSGAGTGHGDDDDLRELAWRDHAGQLFISNGQSALDSDDLPATFTEAVRLRATERFVGLADFSGDGRDDLLGRNVDGALVMALAPDSDGTDGDLQMVWNIGTDDSTADLDLIGALDVDEDGGAEIAGLNGDALEIWNAETGLQSSWTL